MKSTSKGLKKSSHLTTLLGMKPSHSILRKFYTKRESDDSVFCLCGCRQGSHEHKLRIRVNDKDLVGSDKIGEGKLDVTDAYNGVIIDTWIKLPAKLGK
jgi:hypothetical protein